MGPQEPICSYEPHFFPYHFWFILKAKSCWNFYSVLFCSFTTFSKRTCHYMIQITENRKKGNGFNTARSSCCALESCVTQPGLWCDLSRSWQKSSVPETWDSACPSSTVTPCGCKRQWQWHWDIDQMGLRGFRASKQLWQGWEGKASRGRYQT